MDIISVALKRHSTKAFDASKKLTGTGREQIQNSPAIQPIQHNSSRGILLLPARKKKVKRVLQIRCR